MEGGSGNDTYIVYTGAETVVETSVVGRDQVKSYVDYTLGANVEDLALLSPTDGSPELAGEASRRSVRIAARRTRGSRRRAGSRERTAGRSPC